MSETFTNPFRPGAGHMPPYLAGRASEQERFRSLLKQQVITDNLILTGLRGTGKTVLLESFKPLARSEGWLWVGEDFTESKGLTEERIADSIVTDLSLSLAPIFVQSQIQLPLGFTSSERKFDKPLDYSDLRLIYDQAPGVPADKLKSVLRYVGKLLANSGFNGIVFAYDEAQNLGDRAGDHQYPLSLVLDVFQSIQKSPGGLPFMLVLTGLPTLFPKLNEARTYTERMFDVEVLDKLTPEESREAIVRPVLDASSPMHFSSEAVEQIVLMSGGYPYFIQFICKEVFDVWIIKSSSGQQVGVPKEEILRKLDQRFFSARWDNASDRQREFMEVVSGLPNADNEFSVRDVVEASEQRSTKPFSIASAGMMLKTLIANGFIFRNRRGKYSFAVPLLDQFILRQLSSRSG